ncbi:MAG TPA: succinylglutamate desuccinylase/aspartoacylase family protein [Bacillota bacterium]
MSLLRTAVAAATAAFIMVAGAARVTAAEVTRRTILPGTRYATTLYEIDSGRSGPIVWVSGGVHGSELAGWMAAERIAGWDIARGKLIVVPHANQPAVQQRRRSATGDPDLNRQFPQRAGQSARTRLARALWAELLRYRPDWVFDLHEALSNNNANPDSVGQSIIVHPTSRMTSLARRVIDRMNAGLSSARDFNLMRYPVQGSLADAAGQVLGANAAIVETSRQYALSTRIDWHLRIMRTILEELDMNPQTASTGGTSVAKAAAVTAATPGEALRF